MATLEAVRFNEEEMYAEKALLRILFRCIVRGVAEKHGGTLERDPATNLVFVGLPPQAEAAFFQELGNVLDNVPQELSFCKEEPLL